MVIKYLFLNDVCFHNVTERTPSFVVLHDDIPIVALKRLDNSSGGQNTLQNILHELQGNVLNSHIAIWEFAIEIKWSIFCFDRHLLFELVLEVKLACLLVWKAVLTVQNYVKYLSIFINVKTFRIRERQILIDTLRKKNMVIKSKAPHIIVIKLSGMVMKPVRLFCYMFLLAFLDPTVHNVQ